jgi:hypothetical protein
MKNKTSLMKDAGDCHFRTKKGIIAGAETVANAHRFTNEKGKNMSYDVFLSFATAFNAGAAFIPPKGSQALRA